MEEKRWTTAQESAISLKGAGLLVSAAAGSGKTAVLTERIIRSLTDEQNPADISRILVVTFTRAAATDLKNKISEALNGAITERPDDEHLSKQLFLLGGAQISTIDSFFQKLVRDHFEKLSVPASFRIADEGEIGPLSEEILDGVISEFYGNGKPARNGGGLFGAITENPFANALNHILSDRSDGKLHETLLRFYRAVCDSPDGLETLSRFARDLGKTDADNFFTSPFGAFLREEYSGRVGAHKEFLKGFIGYLSADPDLYAKCSPLVSSDLAFCDAVLEALDASDYGKVYSAVQSFQKGIFPKFTGKKTVKTEEVAEYQRRRERFNDRTVEKGLRRVFSVDCETLNRQIRETVSFAETFYRFFREYKSRIDREKRTLGIFEYSDIREMVDLLLTAPDGTATELAKDLSASYDAVYIDEYQDVDYIQDRIFRMIGGNKRFMVGDIKQSIYGFRGSEPGIFADYRKKFRLYREGDGIDPDGVCIFMSNNFRCDKPVIDFSNLVCSYLFTASERSVAYRAEDDLVFSKLNGKENTPKVCVAAFEKVKNSAPDADNGEENVGAMIREAEWTAGEIARLIREEQTDKEKPIRPGDVAILVRNSKQAKPFLNALRKLRIPCKSDKSDSVLNDPLITETFDLLRAVDNPYRDLPLTEFLLSPMGGFRVEELSRIRDAGSLSVSLFEAMENCPDTVGTELAARAKSTAEWLREQQKLASVRPADKYLRLLYLDARVLPYAESPALRFLYDQARAYQRSSFCGIYGYLHYLEKLLATDSVSSSFYGQSEDAVTVMTMHRSKGLEYPVVFVSACGQSFNREEKKNELVFRPEIGCAVKLYDPETGKKETTVLRDTLLLRAEQASLEEEIRLLYVALTRAKERLYVTGTLSCQKDKFYGKVGMIRRGDRYSILDSDCFLLWVYAALTEHGIVNDTFPCVLREISADEKIPAIPLEPTDSQPVKTDSGAETDEFFRKRYEGLSDRPAKEDPAFRLLQNLPTKAAASKLSPDLLDSFAPDADGDESLETQIELMRGAEPVFSAVHSGKSASAAEIGTATHEFLQFCDYASLRENGIDAEFDRLVADGFLSPEEAGIVDREQLRLFLSSDLFTLLGEAQEVRREQKFGMYLPYSDFTTRPELIQALDGKNIFVQGSIDLLITTRDGELILVDYKTDRLNDAEKSDDKLLVKKLTDAHAEQLSCYAKAVRMLYGKTPDRICVYSVPAGKTVEIPAAKTGE